MKHYLYLITRQDGERYIGVTSNTNARFLAHKNSDRFKGFAVSCEVLLEGEYGHIYSLEEEYIQKYKCSLNRAKGGAPGTICGEDHHNSKLNDKVVREILEKYFNENKTQESIASFFGISQSTVSLIVHNKTWTQVSREGFNMKTKEAIKESKNLNDKQTALALRKQGYSLTKISSILGIGTQKTMDYCADIDTPKRTKVTEDIKNSILKLREQGHSWVKIGATLGIHESTARKYYKIVKSVGSN